MTRSETSKDGEAHKLGVAQVVGSLDEISWRP